MRSHRLGSSAIDVTEIGLGTNYVGGHNLYDLIDEDAGVRLVQQAVDSGINFIDTADIYGTGRSEELVGKALAGRTHDVVVATKGAIVFKGTERTGVSNAPSYLRRALENSLKRLNRDYVDLYYIHKPDGITPIEEAYGELMRMKEEGKIRIGGLSNFDVVAIERARSAGPVDAVQSRYNLLQRDVEREVLPYCAANNISFIPWGPLAYGLLSGKYDSTFRLLPGDWRSRTGLFDEEIYEKSLILVDRLKSIANERSIPLTHLAIRWLLARPAVTSVIAGAKRPEQVLQNAGATGWELDAGDMERIREMIEG